MLYAKYGCSSPYDSSQVDFKRFHSLFLCKIGCARAKPKYDSSVYLGILGQLFSPIFPHFSSFFLKLKNQDHFFKFS